jgi:hypothetical protein
MIEEKKKINSYDGIEILNRRREKKTGTECVKRQQRRRRRRKKRFKCLEQKQQYGETLSTGEKEEKK